MTMHWLGFCGWFEAHFGSQPAYLLRGVLLIL
jgi:hypothetical protein